MKKQFPNCNHIFYLVFCIFCFLFVLPKQVLPFTNLPGFKISTYYNEQVTTFKLLPEIRIHINAPSPENFDAEKPVGLALFALPNGNTIEHTVGKILQPGDDWHYDIQHIQAQTRFLRQNISDYNLVTVYLECQQKSWPAWKAKYPDYANKVKSVVDYLKSCFKAYSPFVILTGHSGGGRFIFSFMDAFDEIPDYVERICFLDSNYGYEHSYGDQFIHWLDGGAQRYLSVLAYNDSIALYNGNPIVSPTGGTWYRTKMMQKYMANHYTFLSDEDDEFITHEALQGRIKIFLKKNPNRAILHTVQVEKNGFVHTMLTGTDLEDNGYTYYGDRCYAGLIQEEELKRENVQIPLRSGDAIQGDAFMESIKNLSFADREVAIQKELSTGNLPWFMREMKEIESTFNDANGNSHQLKYRVMPDYLAIGSDSNFCRVPMGPITAQRVADFFGTCMPTRKLVDDIYANAEIKVAPVTYLPVGNNNERVEKFIEHNTAIQDQFDNAGGLLGQLFGGTKKDVVLSNKIIDPARTHHVTIYGWHRLNGEAIQPLTNIHIDTYVDYSHGIRYLDSEIHVDGGLKTIQNILKDPLLYKLLSDEHGVMVQPSYIANASLPEKPRSFGLISDEESNLKVILNPDPSADFYLLYLSDDGLQFEAPVTVTSGQHILEDLPTDSIVYIMLQAHNTAGSSPESEVLAAIPGAAADSNRILVVNGFDRTSSGNTYNFIRQHAAAINQQGILFESATNDAVIDGLFDLQDYQLVDYILGEESTADETFSGSEQIIVSSFLKQGGRLFVSGAEIAWDLDYKGSTSDKAFIRDYLRSRYSADAPGGVSGAHYSAEGIAGGIFKNISHISYDNGTHGTYNVKYADALVPQGGSISVVKYKGVSSHTIGGVTFEGTFKGGTQPGKLVYLGFPFETVYPASTRNEMMAAVLDFLLSDVTSMAHHDPVPLNFKLYQNYPNPFNPVTMIKYSVGGNFAVETRCIASLPVELSIYNLLGQKITTLVSGKQSPGNYQVQWHGLDDLGHQVSSGTYIYTISMGDFVQSKKMILVR